MRRRNSARKFVGQFKVSRAPPPARAGTNNELRREIETLNTQKREMQDEIRRTTAESRALLQRMGVLTSTMKAAGRFRRNIMLRREQNPSVQTALDALQNLTGHDRFQAVQPLL